MNPIVAMQAALRSMGVSSTVSQVFDSAEAGKGPGVYQYVVPADVHVVAIDATPGGGGGGGGGTSSGNGGGGGGGAGVGVKDYLLSVIPGSTLTLTVGDGGLAGIASTGASATAGGNGEDVTITGALDVFPTLYGGLGALVGGVGGSGGNCIAKSNAQGGSGGQVPSGANGSPPTMMQQTMLAITTTGTISAASNSLALASASTVQTGSKVRMPGAGPAGADLITDVTLLSGTTASLRSNATTAVTGGVVYIETNSVFAQRHPNVFPGGAGGGGGGNGHQSMAFPGGAANAGLGTGLQGTGGGGAGNIHGPGGEGGAASGAGVQPSGFGGGGGGGGWKATTGTVGGKGAPGRIRIRPVA